MQSKLYSCFISLVLLSTSMCYAMNKHKNFSKPTSLFYACTEFALSENMEKTRVLNPDKTKKNLKKLDSFIVRNPIQRTAFKAGLIKIDLRVINFQELYKKISQSDKEALTDLILNSELSAVKILLDAMIEHYENR